jgi:hypothetical protein
VYCAARFAVQGSALSKNVFNLWIENTQEIVRICLEGSKSFLFPIRAGGKISLNIQPLTGILLSIDYRQNLLFHALSYLERCRF